MYISARVDSRIRVGRHSGISRLCLFLLVAVGTVLIGCAAIDELDDSHGPRNRRAKTGDARCFDTFDNVKKYLHDHGTPKRDHWQWHHIVGQHSANIAKFTEHDLHCTDNLVYLPRKQHEKLNGHYSRKTELSGGRTVRSWLASKSFDDQYEYGIKQVEEVRKSP